MSDEAVQFDSLGPGETLRTCATCGQAHVVPEVPSNMCACCVRCGSTMERSSDVSRSNSRTTALALTALILYPLGVGLPLVRIERFGFGTDESILSGVVKLLSSGDYFVGLIVLVCSVVFPLFKLFGLLVLSAGGMSLQHHHRALTYQLVEWTGRWGMLDVLLVAVLVAAVKIGDLVEVTAGPAAVAFGVTVLFSLFATAAFNPHALWSGLESDDA